MKKLMSAIFAIVLAAALWMPLQATAEDTTSATTTDTTTATTIEEPTYNLMTQSDENGNDVYVIQDSAAPEMIMKMKCPYRKPAKMFMNLPLAAICAFQCNALGHGCSYMSPLASFAPVCKCL